MPSFTIKNVVSSVQYNIRVENYTHVLSAVCDRWSTFYQTFFSNPKKAGSAHPFSIFYTSQFPLFFSPTNRLFSEPHIGYDKFKIVLIHKCLHCVWYPVIPKRLRNRTWHLSTGDLCYRYGELNTSQQDKIPLRCPVLSTNSHHEAESPLRSWQLLS
jgi:hypothetical protein